MVDLPRLRARARAPRIANINSFETRTKPDKAGHGRTKERKTILLREAALFRPRLVRLSPALSVFKP
jgi:hypothetical protein